MFPVHYVLIVAECNVNVLFETMKVNSTIVLIVAECNVNFPAEAIP